MSSVRILAFTQEEIPLEKGGGNFEFFKYELEGITRVGLSDLLRLHRPNVIITLEGSDVHLLNDLPFQIRQCWIHLPSVKVITQEMLERCYLTASFGHYHASGNPLISVVTTSYLSGHKIARSLLSLLHQTYNNWEWLIFDDSPNSSDNWELLQHLSTLDFRIRVFRSENNDGVIGSVKRNVSMLARGDFIVELDHDDILTPDILSHLVAAGREYPEAGFFYSDFTEIHEAEQAPPPGRILEGSERNFKYGDNWGFGYGAYMAHLYPADGPDKKWRYVAMSPPLNYRTLRHIVAMPNHVRVWRAALYRQLSGHNPTLPVADDYELCLRTFLAAPCVRIASMGYLQFRNRGGNNFTFHRNALIARLTVLISNHYFHQVHKKLLEMNLPDPLVNAEGKRVYPSSPDTQIWIRPEQFPPRAELTYRPKGKGLVSVIAVAEKATQEDVLQIIFALKAQTYSNWELLILGNECNRLEETMNNLIQQCDGRVRWWNVESPSYEDPCQMRNYGLLMAAQGDYVTYVQLGKLDKDMYGFPRQPTFFPSSVDSWEPDHLASLVQQGKPLVRTTPHSHPTSSETSIESERAHARESERAHTRESERAHAREILFHPGPICYKGTQKYHFWLREENGEDFLARWENNTPNHILNL